MNDIVFRTANLSDALCIAQLSENCFSEPWRADGIINAMNQNGIFTVAEDGGRIIAFAGGECVLDECYIHNVAVESSYRRRGIGKKVLVMLIRTAAKIDVSRFILDVRESNSAAIKMYTDIGFVPLAVRKNFYSKPVENGITMSMEESGKDEDTCDRKFMR